MLLMSQDNITLRTALQKPQTYTSKDIQNELIGIMANMVMAEIVDKVNGAKYYSLLVDETTDTSNKEQAVICLR